MDATKIEKAIKRNGEYWKRRFDFLEQVEHSKTTEYIKDLNELYGKAISNCDTEISKWYQRIADNNGISFTEAKKLLNKNELKEFKWTVEEYIKHGKENAVNQKWIKELENASAKVHISRLEAMKMQMRQQVELITANEAQGVEGLLKDVYEDSYYRSIFELQKGFGIGTSFSRLNSDTISKIIHKPWAADGSDFSERIWGKYRPELINHLHTELTQAFIRGENPKTLAKAIAKKFKTTQARAENLVLTESAFFRASGQKKAYENMNVDKFEILATLDSRTSELCRYMDGKVFETKDLQVGVNHPPFHNRCRSTSVPYFNDEFTAWEERIAKDKDGEYYYVPANITYDEWIKNMSGGRKIDFGKIMTIPREIIKKLTPKNQPLTEEKHDVTIKLSDYPQAFSATKAETKNTQMLLDYVNGLEGANSDTLELYRLMGKMENIESQGIPFKISHGEKCAVSSRYYIGSGKYSEVKLTIPKLTFENLVGAVNTTLHEEMHLMDLFLREGSGYGAFTQSQSLAGEFIDVVKKGDKTVGSKVETLFKEYHAELKTIRKTLQDEADAKVLELTKAYYPNGINYSDIWNEPKKYKEYEKKKKKIQKETANLIDMQNRNAMGGGIDGLEDIYDALSGGEFRGTGVVHYGHGRGYYAETRKRTSEIIANYGALSITRPDLIELLREDKPELVSALEKLVKDMIKAVK